MSVSQSEDYCREAVETADRAKILYRQLQQLDQDHELVGFLDESLCFTPAFNKRYSGPLSHPDMMIGQKHAVEMFVRDLEQAVESAKVEQH